MKLFILEELKNKIKEYDENIIKIQKHNTDLKNKLKKLSYLERNKKLERIVK